MLLLVQVGEHLLSLLEILLHLDIYTSRQCIQLILQALVLAVLTNGSDRVADGHNGIV